MKSRIALLIALLCLTAHGQVSFEKQQYLADGGILKQVDLNGDGVPDFITFPASFQAVSNGAFEVILSNGDGSYRAPVHYITGGGKRYFNFANGDFNKDGKQDLVVADGTNLYLFFGNGDGTLKPPVRLATTGLPTRVAVGDFNEDGNLDVVVQTFQSCFGCAAEAYQLLFGKGDGTFSAPITRAIQNEPGEDGHTTWAVGDFDGDHHQDFVFAGAVCGESACAEQVNIFFGDGTGNFTETGFIGSFGGLIRSIGFDIADLNKDGRSDLVGASDASTIEIVRFSSNRTFIQQHVALSPDLIGFGFERERADLAGVADYNGDGINDIAVSVFHNDAHAIAILLGKPDGTFQSPSQYIAEAFTTEQPLTGDYNGDRKPDLAAILFDANEKAALQVLLNTSTGHFDTCSAPTANGVHVCSPINGSTVTSPVKKNATAKLASPIYRFELWVDHVKFLSLRNTVNMFTNITLPQGNHQFDFVARNSASSERYIKTVFAKVCGAPSTVGINVCSPVDGSTVSSPVAIKAYAKVSGTIYRFELWVDGVKKVSVANSGTMQTSLALGTGTRLFEFVARNTAGSRIVKSVKATVK